MMKKRSIALLISAIIGLIYGVYLVTYFAGLFDSSASTSETLGAGLATALVFPHMLSLWLAVLFNIIGWAINGRGFALTAGILYSVSALVFFIYAAFVVPSIIFSFVGFARLQKIIEHNKNATVTG